MAIEQTVAEKFLYQEAELLDSNRFDEWLALWTADAIYWIPCNEYEIDPTKHVSLIYDDRNGLEARIERLKSEAVWAQNPRSRMRRLIANVICEVNSDREATVSSNFILHEVRRHAMNTWTGRTIHHLRQNDGKLMIASKKVLLLNNDEFIPNFMVLL